MKAKLVLKIDDGDDNYHTSLGLYISITSVRNVCIYGTLIGDSFEEYKESLTDVINESALWLNAVDGIKLYIDNSVYEFLEQDYDEVEKFVNKLIQEL